MTEWFERSFGEDYLLVYRHRDFQGAYQEVQRMVQWLSLPANAKVLDLCCGMGRHSKALSDSGYEVTGIDLSEVLLREARMHDKEQRVRFVRSDMRQLPLDESFDAIFNLFTSFGYFEEDEENLKVLLEMKRVLKPKAPFIIDFLNPEYVEQTLVPYSLHEEDKVRIQQFRKIQAGYVKKDICITDEQGQRRTYSERVKLYSRDRFVELIEQAGLQVNDVYGHYDERPFDASTSARMIFVGQS